MVRKRILQIATILLDVLALSALFLPAFEIYGATDSLWPQITENFRTGSPSGILTDAIYYLPIIVSGILVALLESKIRYAVTLFAASGGLTLLLSQYLFPAVEQAYLGAVYQVGLYALLAVQIALLLVSCAGICLKEEPKGKEPSIDFKRDTLELPIADIDQALLDGETVDQ